MDELQKARETINALDRELASLFCKRMEAVRAVAEYKAARGLPILDASREEEVIARGASLVDDPELRAYYLLFLRETMKISKQYQRRRIEGMRVAYSGVEGAFAHIAAGRIFPDSRKIPHPDFPSAYEAVVRGDCDCAVLPLENSYAGEVGQVIDLAFSGPLYINGIYDLPVTQNLIGLPDSTLAEIRCVVSHPQALEQCAGYVRRHGWEEHRASNTAVAAQIVAERGDRSLAAIASAETASLYGLTVLDHDINESALNTTRFAVFSRVENKRSDRRENNFLLLFTVRNEAGALARAVSVIGEHGFNLRVLRSRPIRDQAWQYYFYVEAEGDETSEAGRKMLAGLARHCDRLKVVGRYATGSPLTFPDRKAEKTGEEMR